MTRPPPLPSLFLLRTRGTKPKVSEVDWAYVQERLRQEKASLDPVLVPGDTWCLATFNTEVGRVGRS